MRKLSLLALAFTVFGVGVKAGPAWALDPNGEPPELTIFKEVDKSEAQPGEVLTYTITVVNQGRGRSTNTIVTDFVPANTTYVPGSTTLNGEEVEDLEGGVSPLSAGLNVGTLAAFPQADRVAVITFQVRINPGTPADTIIRNTATVFSDDNPTVESNEVTTRVLISVDLEITKSANVSEAAPGDLITFTITVRNVGNATATGVIVRDPVLVFVAELGSIAPGESQTLTVQRILENCPEPGTTISNTSTVESDQTERESSNTVVITVLPDRTPPTITITEPAEGTVLTRCDTLRVTADITDECPGVDRDSIVVRVGGTVVAGTITEIEGGFRVTATVDLFLLPLGPLAIEVTASDLVGNTRTETRTITLDCSFDCALELIARASAAGAFKCPGVDRTLFSLVQRAQSLAGGSAANRELCRTILEAAIECVARRSRVPGRGAERANFRSDAQSEAFARVIEEELRCLLAKC